MRYMLALLAVEVIIWQILVYSVFRGLRNSLKVGKYKPSLWVSGFDIYKAALKWPYHSKQECQWELINLFAARVAARIDAGHIYESVGPIVIDGDLMLDFDEQLDKYLKENDIEFVEQPDTTPEE